MRSETQRGVRFAPGSSSSNQLSGPTVHGIGSGRHPATDQRQAQRVAVTGDPDADKLLNTDPLALLLGMLLDQHMR